MSNLSMAAETGSLPKPDHWMFAGTRRQEGGQNPGPHRLGIPRPTGRDRRAGSCCWRNGLARGCEPSTMDGDDLSWPQRKLCFQCGHHLLGSRAQFPRLGHVLPWSHWSRPHGPGCSGAEDHKESIEQSVAKLNHSIAYLHPHS